jgi:hypothetical protein
MNPHCNSSATIAIAAFHLLSAMADDAKQTVLAAAATTPEQSDGSGAGLST